MRGRKPQPTRLRILNGNRSKTPLNAREPRVKVALPRCPSHVKGKARKAWAALGKQLEACGVLTKLDAVAFELLCQSYGAYLTALEKIEEGGPIWMEKGDGLIPKFTYSPFWTMANREWAKVQKMLIEFGMTPSSRSRIVAGDQPIENTTEERYFG